MMIDINIKIFTANYFLNIGTIYGYLNGAIYIIGGTGYVACLVEIN